MVHHIPILESGRARRVDSFIQPVASDMAPVCVLRTSGLFLLLFLIINTSAAVSPPWILSVRVDNVSCFQSKCVYKLKVNGLNVEEWSLTSEPATRGCKEFLIVKKELETEFEVPVLDKKLFFCAKSSDGVWFHQGGNVYLDSNDVIRRTEFAER